LKADVDVVLWSVSRLLSRASDICAFATRNFGDLRRVLGEVRDRSDALRFTIDTAVRTAERASADIADRGERANQDVATITDASAAALIDLRREIEDAARNAREVMGAVVKIAQETRILALNARIEASRAGVAGRSFTVVANEVGRLADRTMDLAGQADSQLDFDRVSRQLGTVSDQIVANLGGFTERLASDRGAARAAMDDLRANIQEVHRYQILMAEMITANAASSLNVEDKIGRVSDLLETVLRVDVSSRHAADEIEAVARRAFVPLDPNWDRLADIRRQGIVRVGVEPSFVGLSFRQSPGAPLQGLDCEYARAFADWLGVKVEFVEHPWSALTELLHIGQTAGEPPVDIVWSALPPDPAYHRVAYSETYTWLPFVMCRRCGDNRIRSLRDLEGRTAGIINDPGAFAVLEAAGLRWAENAAKPGGILRVSNLIAFNDQTRIHDALADGLVDAFMVDRPIFHWATTARESRWHGRIEVLPGNLHTRPYYYAAAVAQDRASLPLLAAINRFLREFMSSPARAEIECRWQGEVLDGRIGYRDESAGLVGEQELRAVTGDPVAGAA
jgi:ABC-type amino acid transport substrate-binding protein